MGPDLQRKYHPYFSGAHCQCILMYINVILPDMASNEHDTSLVFCMKG